MARNIKYFILLVAAANLISCARMTYFPGGEVQEGIASWYGPDFHGKPTSSKEIYDMHDMTAAHNTLPFGTFVMVKNLTNGKSAIVRINDRGPFVKERVIDLSYAAARVLDMVEPGTAPVRVEVLDRISPPAFTQKFSIQVGAFVSRENAHALRKKLQRKYKNVSISLYETPQNVYYRVRIRAKSREAALKIGRQLADEGYAVLLLEEQ